MIQHFQDVADKVLPVGGFYDRMPQFRTESFFCPIVGQNGEQGCVYLIGGCQNILIQCALYLSGFGNRKIKQSQISKVRSDLADKIGRSCPGKQIAQGFNGGTVLQYPQQLVVYGVPNRYDQLHPGYQLLCFGQAVDFCNGRSGNPIHSCYSI